MPTKPTKRTLPVPLTNEELLAKGQEQANFVHKMGELEAQKKEAAADFKKRIDFLTEGMCQVARIVRDRAEYREVAVTWTPYVDRAEWVVTRDDTGEVVETRTMTADELRESRQGSLVLIPREHVSNEDEIG